MTMMRPSGRTTPRWTSVLAPRAPDQFEMNSTDLISHAANSTNYCRTRRHWEFPVFVRYDGSMPRSQRTRSARAIANDAAILDAAIGEVLRVGVDHVSLRDVGHRAGLTHGATYARYEDVDELLVDIWNSVLCERVTNI